jgi:uncharacterized protein (TIGR02246 family)
MKEFSHIGFCNPGRAFLLLVCAAVMVATANNCRAGDEASVRQASKDYLAALQRGDAKTVADFWTADGTYTNANGRSFKVRDLLAKNAGPTKSITPPTDIHHSSIRFITDDVALEDADFETPASNGAAPIKGHFTALWVRQNGNWKLASLKENRTSAAPSCDDELASLGVFTGEWTGQSDQGTIHISSKWDATKKFLHRDFSLTGGKSPVSGTQEIGWDPISHHIKSWMFIDDGSVSKGLWSLEGTVWMEVSTRTFADGRLSKATQTYKLPDKNTIVWKLIRGSADGKPAQTMEVTLNRTKSAN